MYQVGEGHKEAEGMRAAILNSGPYKLNTKYSHVKSQEKWFSMSVKQREAYLKKLDNACGDVPVASQTMYGDVGSCSLSVTPEEATITSVLLPSIRDIFEKAKYLLEKQTGITAAPESDGTSHMVQSQTSRRPHYVRLCRTTHIAMFKLLKTQ